MATTAMQRSRPAAADGAIEQSVELSVDKLERIHKEYGPQALASLTAVGRSVKLARGVQLARMAVAEILPHVRHLAGTSLGFRTDKDQGGRCGYDDAILADAMTEAVLRGVEWTGNQFNVIAGRCYITKEGYTKLVRELDGLTDLALVPGVPVLREGGAVVPFAASWKINGTARQLKREIPVRLNSGMGADGAIGKATRKMLASIYAQVTGSAQSAADADDDATEPQGAIAAGGRAAELGAKLNAAQPKPEPTPPAKAESDPDVVSFEPGDGPAGDGRLFDGGQPAGKGYAEAGR